MKNIFVVYIKKYASILKIRTHRYIGMYDTYILACMHVGTYVWICYIPLYTLHDISHYRISCMLCYVTEVASITYMIVLYT